MKPRIVNEYVECYGVWNIVVYRKDKVAGRVLLLNLPQRPAPILLDIYIYRDEDRRKGLADALIEYVTSRFDLVQTSFLSNAGLQLCLKHGFVWERSMYKNQPERLWYSKESVEGKGEQHAERDGAKT